MILSTNTSRENSPTTRKICNEVKEEKTDELGDESKMNKRLKEEGGDEPMVFTFDAYEKSIASHDKFEKSSQTSDSENRSYDSIDSASVSSTENYLEPHVPSKENPILRRKSSNLRPGSENLRKKNKKGQSKFETTGARPKFTRACSLIEIDVKNETEDPYISLEGEKSDNSAEEKENKVQNDEKEQKMAATLLARACYDIEFDFNDDSDD